MKRSSGKYYTGLKNLQPRALVLVGVVFMFAGIGVYMTFSSKAAGPFASVESESAARAGNATVASDAAASGGQYIQFNAPAVSGGFPNCASLGPTTTLTNHSGNFFSDQGSASGKAITGDLILDSAQANYTTSNFSVQGKVRNELSGSSSLNVSDFVIRHPSYSGDWGLGYHNVTARRFRIENHSDGIRVAGTGGALYEDFCITGVAQPGDHSDGIQFYGSTNAAAVTTFRRGIITMPSGDATAGIFAADGAKGTVVVDTVLFIGGPYGIRINSDGVGKIGLKHVRFRRDSFGAAPFSIASNIQITEWTDVAYEDGQAIPPPHAVQP